MATADGTIEARRRHQRVAMAQDVRTCGSPCDATLPGRLGEDGRTT